MEFFVNERFVFSGYIFTVIKGDCRDCYFKDELTSFCTQKLFGECEGRKRKDNTDICFKLI